MSYFGRGSFESNILDVFGAPDPAGQGVTGFLYPFGSPNGTGVSSVCAVSYNLLAAIPTIGASMHALYPDFENTDLLVVWGTNPPTDSPPDKVKKVLAAKKRG